MLGESELSHSAVQIERQKGEIYRIVIRVIQVALEISFA
jgi:hypothetical protein